MTTAPSPADVIAQFNRAFVDHEPNLLDGLVAENCVMESVDPAPDGTRHEGGEACLAFWRALALDRAASFAPERVDVAGERAIILWRYTFGSGPAESVRGVNVMRVVDGRITEALGYVKSGDAGVAEALQAALS